MAGSESRPALPTAGSYVAPVVALILMANQQPNATENRCVKRLRLAKIAWFDLPEASQLSADYRHSGNILSRWRPAARHAIGRKPPRAVVRGLLDLTSRCEMPKSPCVRRDV
jgi:hypothetical protein